MVIQEYQVIRDAFEKRGMTIAEMARRAGMDSELLRRSLEGTRNFKAHEFTAVCMILGLSIADFEGCFAEKPA